jgi:G3E family GTPase
LVNGYACCLVNDDLELPLQNLVEAATYDQVVFEASGVADAEKLLRQLGGFSCIKVIALLAPLDVSVSQCQVQGEYVGGHIKRQLRIARNIVATTSGLLDHQQQALVQQ